MATFDAPSALPCVAGDASGIGGGAFEAGTTSLLAVSLAFGAGCDGSAAPVCVADGGSGFAGRAISLAGGALTPECTQGNDSIPT